MASTNPPPHVNNHDNNNMNDNERKHHEEGVVVRNKKHRHHHEDDTESRSKLRRKRHREDDNIDDDDDDYNDDHNDDDEVARKKKKEKKEKKRKEKKKKKRKHKKKRARSSSSSSSSDNDDTDDDAADDYKDDGVERFERKHHDTTTTGTTTAIATTISKAQPPQLQIERQERRRRARAALMESKFGYTVDDNPFHDPNLTDTFVWNKKKQVERTTTNETIKKKKTNTLVLMGEIDKVRERRQQREEQKMELERIRAQESRMKEYEHYDQFQHKEEVFHYQQQKLRSAIRLMQHREKPIDIFAKQILLFGGLDDNNNNSNSNNSVSTTKYQENYNVLDISRDTLEMEMEEPYLLLKSLTYEELQELLRDILVFSQLERDAATATSASASTGVDTNTTAAPWNHHTTLLQYWENLAVLTRDEMKYLQPSSSSSNDNDDHAKMVREIAKIFVDQSIASLQQMKDEIATKLQQHHNNRQDDPSYDHQYWTNVQEQIQVYMAKQELSQLHAQMLTRQLQRLEQRRVELLLTTTTTANANAIAANDHPQDEPDADGPESNDPDATRPSAPWTIPANVPVEMLDDLEEELGLAQEVTVLSEATPRQPPPPRDNNNNDNEQYRSRKPRYYNRVKSGYDWSKYNQTHYDRDNPPPKIVQGYKFNIFYPDLINPMITPQFTLEPVVLNGNPEVSRDYCIIRFRAGPPYEDLAFQIVNREWNRSRKRGYKCTFERGVLSLYFNFTTHWYRK